MCNGKPATPEVPIAVEAHPPERGRHGSSVKLCAGCCCCCCCCLHSVGSVVGAAAASGRWYNWEKDEREPSAGPIYWGIFAVVALISLALAAASREIAVGLIIVALVVPFLQLAISLIALVVIALASSEETKGPRLRSLGRITLFSVAGGFVGFIAMVATAWIGPLLF
jgi:hypothetical protein